MKNLIRSGINKFDKHYAEMEKPARIALRTGLLVVASASLVLLSMLCHAESAARFRELYEALPALAASVPIVFAGAAAIDWVIKEK